jgi:ribosomal protein S18 acetylase RimI-like enzyme
MEAGIEIPDLTLRPAQPEDAHVAAKLLYQTIEGLGAYMFGSDPCRPVLGTLKELFVRAENRFSHCFASIAESGGDVVGLLMAYPGEIVTRLDATTGRHLLGLFSLTAMFRLAWRSLAIAGPEAKRGEYHIANVAVLPRFQGRGIESRLLALAEEQARAAGLSRTSLCVDMDNAGAKRLYQRTGYRIVLTWLYHRRVAAMAGRGYLRLVKHLDGLPSS